MKKHTCLFIMLFAAMLLFPSHDYWFEARPFILDPGDSLRLHLLVGDDLVPSLERGFEREPTLSFVMADNNGINDLIPVSTENKNVFASLVMTKPGFYLFGMERDFSYISLNRDEFMEYLMHEEIADRRELLDWLKKSEIQNERYARSVKTLVSVNGEAGDNGVYRMVFNHDFEIILENNPYLLQPGGILKVVVLKKGVPAMGMKVMAHNKTDEFTEYTKVSSSEGKVTFKLDKPGEWVIRSLWLRPCTDCDTINWESHWASFSFCLQK